jgi:hypothetical protein
MCPTTALANRNIRLVMPPVFIRFPASIKKGIASSVKLVVEAYILCGSMVKSDPWPKPMKNRMAVKAMATAIGIFNMMSNNKSAKIRSVSILSSLFKNIQTQG